jgi:predicted nucleic acid-binding Zn ribbon protein
MAATLECSNCGHEESPLRHYYQSNCGGAVAWQGGTLRCQKCGMRIYLFRCDKCGQRLGERNVS